VLTPARVFGLPGAQGSALNKGTHMKRIILATVAAAALCAPALAADLPAAPYKAPAYVDFFSTPGFYWGIEAGAGVQNSSTSSALFANQLVSGKLTADGGTVGGCLGFMRGNAAQWNGFQGCLDYQNIAASQTVANQSIGVASRWSGTLEFRLGGTTSQFANVQTALANLGISGVTFPTFTPVAPGGVDVNGSTPRSYVAGGGECVGMSGTVGAVGGANVACGPMLKLGAMWPVFNSKPGPTGALVETATGGVVDVSASVTWLIRGFDINNIGGTSGAPMFSGGVDAGTRYQAKIAYLFPVPR
jgi:outer membrane immunogenic protein